MYEIYDQHGHLLDRQETLNGAERCFWTWFNAALLLEVKDGGVKTVVRRKGLDSAAPPSSLGAGY